MNNEPDYYDNLYFKRKKMISVKELIPLLKHGWVAMDESGEWLWWENEPERAKQHNIWIKKQPDSSDWCNISRIFDIAPTDDWTQSLIKVGGKDD